MGLWEGTVRETRIRTVRCVVEADNRAAAMDKLAIGEASHEAELEGVGRRTVEISDVVERGGG